MSSQACQLTKNFCVPFSLRGVIDTYKDGALLIFMSFIVGSALYDQGKETAAYTVLFSLLTPAIVKSDSTCKIKLCALSIMALFLSDKNFYKARFPITAFILSSFN